jgi:acyl dehydratase
MEDIPLALNYGFNTVRFISPLPVNSRLRMRAVLKSVEDTEGGVRVTIGQTFEREGQDKPICVAESVVLYFNESPAA